MNCLSYCCTLLLAIVSAITFGVDIWVNYESANNMYGIKTITNNHPTQIEPANWMFGVWVVIYVLFVIWYLYIFLLLFRQICCGRRNKSPLFPGIFWLIFIVINVLNGLWVRLYVKNYMVISGIILAVLTLMLYLINMIAFRVCWFDVTYEKPYNDDERDDDIVELSRCDVGLLRLTTLNGLPLYAAWCTVATALQWTMILQYNIFHWSSNISSIVTLAILSFVLLMFWFMEIISLRRYFAYTWSPTILLIVVFSSIIARVHSMGGSHRPGLLFAFILLIVSSAMLLVKFFTLCCCPPKYENQRFSRV
jgi:hypothetical protein